MRPYQGPGATRPPRLSNKHSNKTRKTTWRSTMNDACTKKPVPTPSAATRAQRTSAVVQDRGRRTSIVWAATSAILLLCATSTGLLLYGRGPGGGGLETAHLVSAIALTVSVVRHLAGRHRLLRSLARRRNGKALRSLRAYAALAVLLVASMVTGVVQDGSDAATLHMAVSLVFLLVSLVHASQKMTWRLSTRPRS